MEIHHFIRSKIVTIINMNQKRAQIMPLIIITIIIVTFDTGATSMLFLYLGAVGAVGVGEVYLCCCFIFFIRYCCWSHKYPVVAIYSGSLTVVPSIPI